MDHRTPCSLSFIPDWDADVVPVSMCCCSGIPHEVCNEGTPEEVAPQMSSDEEIVVPRKRPLNQRTIPIWRPPSSRPTADVSSQSEPEQSDQQGTSKTIQEITDEYVASQAAIPTNKTKDISRMERSIVQSFDRRVMDPEVDTYLGDQRYWKNRKKDRAPPKQCNRALAKTSRDEVNKDREQTCCKHHGTFGYQVELEEHLDIRHMFHIKLTCKERQNYLIDCCLFHKVPSRATKNDCGRIFIVLERCFVSLGHLDWVLVKCAQSHDLGNQCCGTHPTKNQIIPCDHDAFWLD